MSIKLKNLLAENMRRFGTKNLSEELSNDETNLYIKLAKKASYDDLYEIQDAAEGLAELLSEPKMEYLPIVQHAIEQLKKWTNAKKPCYFSVYMLVHEAPALLDKMQARSKDAWDEMRSHFGGIVDDRLQDEDELVTGYEPHRDSMI